MKNFWFLLLVFAGFSSCANQEEVIPEHSMLWKVEKDDLKHPVYLFGTMHLIEKSYFHFPEKLEKLVTGSDQLIMELEGLPNAVQAMDLMRLPDSVKINDYFSEEDMAKVYAFAEDEMGMTKEMFDLTFGKMKPFILLQLITQKMFEGDTESYEMTLMGLASEHKITSIGLETVEEQIGFFDQIPQNELALIIADYFDQADSLMAQTKLMQEIYKSGNLDSLAGFMVESSPELMEFEEILLTKRNQSWIPKLIPLIHKKSSFIAVGAAHLAGENGLIELLREKGYKLTPVGF